MAAYAITSFTVRPNTCSGIRQQYILYPANGDDFTQHRAQVTLRVRSGFKYQLEWDPMSPTHFRKFEIQPDGSKEEY